MKKLISVLAAITMLALPISVGAEAVAGKAAPAFEVKDSTGKTHKLSDFKGKWVVLEWYNKDCPYVKKHYSVQNMQKLQKTYTGKGVQWLSVISSAKGKQGHLTAAEAVKVAKEANSSATAVLLDESGVMGKAYDAKTTPHMFVINPEGNVVYAGGIDDNDSADSSVIAKSKNFVAAALDEGMAGKQVTTTSARPYGCSVKY